MMRLGREWQHCVFVAGLAAVVAAFIGVCLLLCAGCVTTTTDGYTAVRILHVDTPVFNNDTWAKWPWVGNPLSWLARQFSSTNAVNTNNVTLGIPNTVAP